MYARAAEPALQDGKRADRGFTVTTGTQTKSHPVIGDIVITAYNNKHWLSSPCALCSRSQIAPADKPTLIAQDRRWRLRTTDLDWPYSMYAKAAEPALQDDKRADRGFTVTTGTQTKSRPVIGDIVITAYTNKHWLSSPCALCSRSQMAPAPWHLRCLQDGVCATGVSAT